MEDLDRALRGNMPCIVLIYSHGCGACTQFSPVYEFACAKHQVPANRRVFVQADTLSKPDYQRMLAAPYNVKGYPTVMVVGNGRVSESKFGRKGEIMDDVGNFMRPINTQAGGSDMQR